MQKQKKAFYAAPGADDTFLRPRAGGAFAPREIALSQQNGSLWTAWLHRKSGKEYLAADFKKPGCRGKLLAVDENASFFSKPAFLNFPASAPAILCASFGKNHWEIRSYGFSGRSWELKDVLPLNGPVYHMDAAACGDGRAWLAYASVSANKKGLSVYTRKLKDGKWERETGHPLKTYSLNRPKLAAGKNGGMFLAADAYTRGGFRIVFKKLKEKLSPAWQTVSEEPGWHLFPSLAADVEGAPRLAWLFQRPVRRGGLLGLSQKAFCAKLSEGKWRKVHDGECAADLNLGLLPAKRYFGYDGLRRHPRITAFSNGDTALIWEQQRDEEENWENIDNGLLCGRLFKNGRWQKPVVLHDGGSCHAFDNKLLHQKPVFPAAVKGKHRPDGNDFRVVEADFKNAAPYEPKPESLWRGWRPETLPLKAKKRSVIRRKNGPPLKLFWADLHCHSVFSPDAEGEPDEQYFFARDLAEIDAACIADNDFYPSKMLLDSEANYTGELAKRISENGKFLALSGYEWTYHRKDINRTFNHRTVIYPEDGKITARRNEPAGGSGAAFKKYLEKTKYFNFPHHAYWKLLGAAGENAVEVTSAWGTCIIDSDTVIKALNKGEKFGFLGNSDSHRFMPGLAGALTGIYAEKLSREAIMDALNSRRSFATTGNRTAVDFRVNGALMGEEIKTKDLPLLEWKVAPPAELESVKIIRDGKSVFESGEKEGKWRDRELPPGRHWYFLQAKERGKQERYPHNLAPASGKYSWTSPVWVNLG